MYISDTLQSAGFHFESMKEELENNELLRSVYGNLVPSVQSRESVKWTNTHFETTNNVNVVARGAIKGRGANIKNNRPTKCIIDDAETDEQVESAMRRRKYHDWLYNVIIPSLDKRRGRVKVIGTNIHPECEVLRFYNAKGGVFRRAIEDGKSIWEEYWPIEDLYKLRDGYTNEFGEYVEGIGTRAFNKEYMNNPTSDDMARIKADWIDENLFTILPTNKKVHLNKVMALDPQSGESESADEYAITVLAWYTGDAHRYVLEQKAGRASQQQQAIEVIRMWLKNKDVNTIGIEVVRTQVAVYQLLLAWRAGKLSFAPELTPEEEADRNIPVRNIVPDGKRGGVMKNKLRRFEMHEAMIERGELHLRPEQKVLREQILFFETGTMDHDDRADSLIMALDLSYKHNSGENRLAGLKEKSHTETRGLWRAKF